MHGERLVLVVLVHVALGLIPLAWVTLDRFARSQLSEPLKEAGPLTPLVCLLFAGGWSFTVCIAIPAGRPWMLEVPFHLTFGGIMYLDRVVKRMNPDPVAVISGLACLAAVAVVLHLCLRWFATAAERNWSMRHTFRVLVLLAVMFVAGVAVTGLIQQTGWLVRTSESLTRDANRIQ